MSAGLGAFVRGNSTVAAAMMTMPIATFTSRHQRQSRYSVSEPPSSRPTTLPLLETAPNTPKALPRADDSVNVVASSDNVAGASNAPNTP